MKQKIRAGFNLVYLSLSIDAHPLSLQRSISLFFTILSLVGRLFLSICRCSLFYFIDYCFKFYFIDLCFVFYFIDLCFLVFHFHFETACMSCLNKHFYMDCIYTCLSLVAMLSWLKRPFMLCLDAQKRFFLDAAIFYEDRGPCNFGSFFSEIFIFCSYGLCLFLSYV